MNPFLQWSSPMLASGFPAQSPQILDLFSPVFSSPGALGLSAAGALGPISPTPRTPLSPTRTPPPPPPVEIRPTPRNGATTGVSRIDSLGLRPGLMLR